MFLADAPWKLSAIIEVLSLLNIDFPFRFYTFVECSGKQKTEKAQAVAGVADENDK